MWQFNVAPNELPALMNSLFPTHAIADDELDEKKNYLKDNFTPEEIENVYVDADELESLEDEDEDEDEDEESETDFNFETKIVEETVVAEQLVSIAVNHEEQETEVDVEETEIEELPTSSDSADENKDVEVQEIA